MDVILTAIVDAVIGYLIDKGADKVGEKLRRDPTKRAFKEALSQAFNQLSKQHPQWVLSNFDASFFQREGAPVLAQFLLMDGQADGSELASFWAHSLNIRDSERRAFYISELEPIAVDFLDDFAHQLKGKEALRDLNISRSLDQATDALQALRSQLNAEKATYGTRRDYLRWLIGRNFYLDPRGTFQTQRQIQVKLNEVYISLQAQLSDRLSTENRRILDKELLSLEVEESITSLTAEEREEKRDTIQKRLESRLNDIKTAEVLELADVVTRYERTVILGDPGSGKKTLLRYLALQHAQALEDGRAEVIPELGKALFPILIRIAEYAEGGTWKRESLSEFLAHCFTVHDCPKRGLPNLLQDALDQGNCLILLDGLDEIVSAEERLGVVKQVEDFVRRYSNKTNRFVITSRIAGYYSVPLGEPFAHYTVREMNEMQIRRFLERWCFAVEEAQTPELSAQERANIARRELNGIMLAIQNPGVRRLAVNPLLLRILALIHRSGAKLPQRRIELYELAADTLARTWRPAQGVSEASIIKESPLLKEDFLTPLLSSFAYWLHINKPSGIATEKEVYNVLGEAWANMNEMHWDPNNPSPKIMEEIRKFLLAVHMHTGLFVERAPKRYGFMHLTFEEYYVARHLVASSRKRTKLIRQHLHEARWEEPIFLALGFVGLDYPNEASELIETAILAQGEEAKEQGFKSSPHEDLLGQDYLFALRCISDNIPIRPKLLRQLMEQLTDEYLKHISRGRFKRYRKALNEVLIHLSGSEGESILLSRFVFSIQDSNADVRSSAASALGQLGQVSPEAVNALVAVLQDSNADVRSSAASALGQLGHLEQVSLKVAKDICQNFHSLKAWNVRADAARLLGQIRQADNFIINTLWNGLLDKNDNVRKACAQSLAQIGKENDTLFIQIEELLVQTIQGSEFEQVDQYVKRSAQDFAYDGFWLLMNIGEAEGM